MRRLFKPAILAAILLPAGSASAITWKVGNYNSSTLQCRLIGWSGNQPSSGKLTIPTTYKNPDDGKEYTIVTIGEGALDSLTTVTQITIPANITKIGQSGKGISQYDDHLTNNFRGCPKLAKFIVSSENKYFTTAAGGCLKLIMGNEVLNVPANIATASGTLTLGEDVEHISGDAFADNTSITKLELNGKIMIDDNGGLNRAKNLARYIVNEPDNISVIAGVLYSTFTSNYLVISLPPASSISTVTIPDNATWVTKYAFYGCKRLKSIDLNKVTYIGGNAFAKSGLTDVTIPATVSQIWDGAFQRCTSLQTITVKGELKEICPYFARNCTSLTKVTFAKLPASIDEGAFKGCTSLTNFPFSGGIVYKDACFQGCGFKKVVFNADNYRGFGGCINMFASNANLEEIDLSAMTGTNRNSYDFQKGYAANCPKLETLRFPEYVNFITWSEHIGAAFGPGCALTKIVARGISNTDKVQQFVYAPAGDKTHFRPRVFVAATALKYANMDYNGLFGARQGATVTPDYILDIFAPTVDSDDDNEDCNNYVDPNAVYYVPGGAADNYRKAKAAGCTVKEFYFIEFDRSGDRLFVLIHQEDRPQRVPALSDITVDFGDGIIHELGTGGSTLSDINFKKVKKVRVSYTCSGVRMCTDYAGPWNSSGIDAIDAESAITDPTTEASEYYTTDGLRIAEPIPGTICIERTGDGKSRLIRK